MTKFETLTIRLEKSRGAVTELKLTANISDLETEETLSLASSMIKQMLESKQLYEFKLDDEEQE